MLNVNTTLAAMLEPIVNIDSEALAKSPTPAFVSDINNLLAGYPLRDPMDECSYRGLDIDSDCKTFAKAQLMLELAYKETSEKTRIALDSAKSVWKIALLTFQEQINIAQLDLELAEDQAKAAFKATIDFDWVPSVQEHAATLKIAYVTARQIYETTVESAASSLSSAAATLISAYSAFVAETIFASLTAMKHEAKAEQAFWQAVETKPDS